jgi:S-DNA-T family DNA segregation ATPase FtsK/SpoIIIE
VDTATTVADLADYLSRADPSTATAGLASGRGRPTLVVSGSTDSALDPSARVAESGLVSGMTVGLTWTAPRGAPAHGEAVAVVTVLSGPAAPDEIVLRSRSGVIGRDPACAVVLRDPMVSRRHVRFSIGALPEVVDLASANGMLVGDSPVTRAVLHPGDRLRVGDSELAIRALSGNGPVPGGLDPVGAGEGFVRSPRLAPHYVGQTFDAPEAPRPPAAQRFPIIALIAPILLGSVLYLVTHSVLSLLFVALSPLMTIGYAVENRWAGRSAYRKAVAQYYADLDELAGHIRAAAAAEITARGLEHPPLSDVIAAVRRCEPLLWTRRPEDPGFCELRLGLGRQPSRSTVTLSARRDQPRALVAAATELARESATVDGVPVLALPAQHGAIGVAASADVALAIARGLVAQVVALHSPAEVVLAAFVPDRAAAHWEWLLWLPHTTSPHSPLAVRHLASTQEGGVALVSALADLLARRAGAARPGVGSEQRDQADATARVVVVLVDNDAPVERSRLVDLAESGARHGIFVIWIAEDTTALPAACRTFVTAGPVGAEAPGLSQGPVGAAGFVHSGESVTPLRLEPLDAATATELGRRLSPLVDVGARTDDASDLPRSVSLLAVSGEPVLPAPDRVLESWRANRSILKGPQGPAEPIRSSATLRAVIGRNASGPHTLDLRTDGPHALVGGTTGSGKSELLQAWILAMAAANSPHRLTFMLIDYKGGSAFKDLNLLPHTVGFFTDLDPHRVRRALVSLRAELRHREHLLAEHHAKDLAELERKGIVDDLPPSLVIVVDEFATLVQELPDFITGMVDVAQRGRSLGVHLILATQRPAGVITGNLLANTNLRLALRTADEQDSDNVLGSTEAAFFDPAIPGRAVSKTGPGRLIPFQTGYAGGWTRDEPPPPDIDVEELRFGSRIAWEPVESEISRSDFGATDIQRMIGAIAVATGWAAIDVPRQPWLPELQARYDLATLRHPGPGRDDELVFGVQDLPEQQRQPWLAFRPDDEGNLAVFGTGGSGKTTLLRTLAVAAGYAAHGAHGARCDVYGLDFGNRGLAMLGELPNVGAIIDGSDTERIARLLNWLGQVVIDRGDKYAQVGAGSITAYRASGATGAANEARILLLVDGIGAFRQAYDGSRLFDLFCQLSADGRPVGVHVIVTADRPGSLPSALASSVQTRVMLRMADPNDFQMMGLPADVITQASPPGRGLLRGVELQVAILGANADARGQRDSIRALAAAMTAAGVTAARGITRMEEKIDMNQLPAQLEGAPVLGRVVATLQPFAFQRRGAFLVAGPPGSGRSAALRAVAVSLRRCDPSIRLHLFCPGRRSGVVGAPVVWTSQTMGLDRAKEHAEALLREIKQDGAPPTAIFIEDLIDFATSAADVAMTDLVRTALSEGVFVVGEGETSTLFSNVGLLTPMKASRYGLSLAPDPGDGDRVFRTPFPVRLPRADFPPGRALFVHGGRTPAVGIGWVEEGGAATGEFSPFPQT